MDKTAQKDAEQKLVQQFLTIFRCGIRAIRSDMAAQARKDTN